MDRTRRSLAAPDGLFVLQPTDDPTRFVWQPPNGSLTPAKSVQGGAGLGTAITAMERVTGRATVWATAQYLTFAAGLDPIDVAVTVEVMGHNTAQARCTLSRHGVEILTAHSALGRRNVELNGMWATMPTVPPPEDCDDYFFFVRGLLDLGDMVEARLAIGRQLETVGTKSAAGDGHFALWVRAWDSDSHEVTTADLAFLGDFLPLGFADALGEPYAGNSLDNTIRVGRPASTGWVLLDVHIEHVLAGIGHGRAHLWAQDGTLLGSVSQTALLRHHTRLRRPTT